MAEVTLVLGAARSGKSAYAQRAAEACAARTGGELVFVATAEALDAEMAERIAHHRDDRGQRWRTVEAPRELATALEALRPDEIVVVDCLTLWLSNSMLADDEGHVRRTAELLAALGRCEGDTWVVGTEVGWGIVPDNALARRFRDEAGRLHQAVAARAEAAVLLVAGLPVQLKGAAAALG